MNSSASSDSNQPSNNDDDDDEEEEEEEEEQQQQQHAAPPVFDRSPPPELEGFPDIPDPNVLGIGGHHNVITRGYNHVWGGGVRLGAVEYNPHVAEPVLRAQTPGESAVMRLEMRQHWQLQPEAGTDW